MQDEQSVEQSRSYHLQSLSQSVQPISPYRESAVGRNDNMESQMSLPQIQHLMIVASPSPKKMRLDANKDEDSLGESMHSPKMKSSQENSELCMMEIVSPFRNL